MRLQKFD